MQEPTEEFETQVDVEAFGEVLVDINTFVTQVSDFVEIFFVFKLLSMLDGASEVDIKRKNM